MLTGSRRAVWARAKFAVRGSAQLAYASPAAQRVAMPAAEASGADL
jgi:hypothetical protein